MMTASSPLVTIGIPTYNRADSDLPAALESALNQTYTNIEVVVSDNCSSDNTGEFVKGIQDKRVRYLKQGSNVHPNTNFNTCLEAASGDYFLLLHDDDLIDDDFVDTCLSRAEYSTDYGFILTGTRIIDETGRVTNEMPHRVASSEPADLYRSWLNGDTTLYFCSLLFNTEALRQIGGLWSKNNLFEDAVAIVQIANKWKRLDVPEIKASFRQHSNQRTHFARLGHWCEDFKQVVDMICEQLPDSRDEFHDKGMRFFARASLSFAKKVESPIRRRLAILTVAEHFDLEYWPFVSWKLRPLVPILNLLRKRREHAA